MTTRDQNPRTREACLDQVLKSLWDQVSVAPVPSHQALTTESLDTLRVLGPDQLMVRSLASAPFNRGIP